MSELYVKSRNVGFSSDTYAVSFTQSPGGTYTSYSKTVVPNGRINGVDSLNGVKNPFWKTQVKNGQNATTNCSGTRYSFRSDFLTTGYTLRAPPTSQSVIGHEFFGIPPINLPVAGSPSGSITTEITNRAIRKFLDSCSNARSSVEAGQDFGEWRETIESLVRPMNSMKNLIEGHYSRLTKAKKRFRGQTPSLKKALADSYLEFVFGWNPLAHDIIDAVKGLTDRERSMPQAPVSGGASRDFSGSNSAFVPSGMLQTTLCNKKSVSSYYVGFKGVIRLNLAGGRIPVRDVLQLNTVQDFVLTGWDLLPYSFLVDYFVNIHDIFQAATFCFSDLIWAKKLVRSDTTETYVYTDSGPNPTSPPVGLTTSRFCYGGNGEGRITNFTRSVVVPSDLIPRVRFSIPTSIRPWANIAALVIGGSLPLRPFF
jgi:hypothetical protein